MSFRHFCLVGPDGTVHVPLKIHTAAKMPHYTMVQMLDAYGQPRQQPWPVPEDYTGLAPDPGMWVIDLQHPPPGYELVEMAAAQWHASQCTCHDKQYNHETCEIEHCQGHGH